jgi:16S rRNA (cytidine1402-2'-O)-methyltransferase
MNTNISLGKLYLIPVTMGECDPMDVLPQTVKRVVALIDYYIVENEKTARKSIKGVLPEKKQSELVLFALNKHTDAKEHLSFIQPLLAGKNMGLMSEAGCPGVADPGAVIVKLAHEKGIQVIPLVGPSSILLAMMASGMNGQSFTFNGYLPIDKGEKKSSFTAINTPMYCNRYYLTYRIHQDPSCSRLEKNKSRFTQPSYYFHHS